MKRILLLATTTGYQTRMFGEAAQRLGVKLVFATDRCDQLDDPWWDGAIPIRFHHESESVAAIMAAAAITSLDGVVAVGDRPTVIAARVLEALGLPGHLPDAARAARDKRLTRERFRSAGLPVPLFQCVARTTDARRIASTLSFPVVVKPTVLSGSRGVIRADNPNEFIAAFERIRRLLDAVDVRALHDPAADDILIEQFIEGSEYALEGVLDHGRLLTLAIFDKPDPLNGPFFEETLYVTPSRATQLVQQSIQTAVHDAARALGLQHGPIHAECRGNAAGVHVLEVAARPIGGLCAQALRFEAEGGSTIGLEDLLLRHAVGERIERWRRERQASGVMMIPIPAEGVYRGVTGVEEAARVPGVRDVRITAKADQHLLPLPEGASYLGFIFANAVTPEAVERALRDTHAKLEFVIDRAIVVATATQATGCAQATACQGQDFDC